MGQTEDRLDKIESVLEKVSFRLDAAAVRLEAASDRLNHLATRLDRLAERHESLAQLVKSLAAVQRENEHRTARLEALMSQSIEAIRTVARARPASPEPGPQAEHECRQTGE